MVNYKIAALLQSESVEEALLWLLIAGLAWVPFWYGSNDWLPWGVNAVLFPGLAGLYELSLLVRGKHHPIAIRYLSEPCALFAGVVLWIGFQTMTFGASSLANPIWKMAGDALGHPIPASISVNRDLTVLALIRLITASAVFWLSLQLCRDPKRAQLFLVAIGTIGVAYAAYGLLALKLGPLSLLPATSANSHLLSATFINPDSYATYAAMGFLVMTALSLRHYGEAMRQGAGNIRLQLSFFIERTGGQGGALLAGTFMMLVALLLTGSRGGIAAGLFGLFTLGAVGRRRANKKSPYALLLIGFFLLVVTMLTFGATVGTKLEQGGVYDENRFAVYLLTVRSILNKPWLGYGYGTFADVFSMYRDRSISVLGVWEQAHDTYLEIFQGLGLVFGTMLIGCVVLLVTRCLKGALRREREISAPAIALSVATLVGAHAIVDFSLQIQAVALTFVALLGLGTAQSVSSRVLLAD